MFIVLRNFLSVLVTVCMDKMNVCMQESVIDIPDIPLNLEHRAKAVILNKGFEPVFFTIRNPTPLPGITIKPSENLLPARSFNFIYIYFELPIVISFEIPIYIDIDGKYDVM